MRNTKWWIFWSVILLLSSYFYFTDTEKYIFYNPEEIGERKLPYTWWLVFHFTAAATTLFLGPIQFIPYIRKRYLKFHRTAGRIYIVPGSHK